MKIEVTSVCLEKQTNYLNVELSFENVKDEKFYTLDCYYRKIQAFDVVICHFRNKNLSEVKDGNESFKLDFICKNLPLNISNSYFVWWNDDQPYDVAETEALILKIIVDKIVEDFQNLNEEFKGKDEPRQGGNGGVLGITNC